MWEEFWVCLDYFLQHVNELDFEGRLNKRNHSTPFPYLVTLIGDCFPSGSTSGTMKDVLFQPKYEDEVYMLLLLIDQLGQYRWVGGLVCGVRSDTHILKELGPQLKDLKKGEVILLDGSFPGRRHGIIPWPKPKKKDHWRWQAKYNDGHSFIRGYGEHPFAQLYTWAVFREACTKLGLNWEESILRLHWMVHVVVHIQHFINKRSVKYKSYGPWGHFPKEMFGTKSCTVDDDSSTSNSDSDSDSDSTTDSDAGSSLTLCSPDSLSSGPNYSPDDK